jgi:hypothetical protein
MKIVSIKKLQELFVGKVCTVLTTVVNKTNFQDQQFSDFFTGVIESIDEDGILAKHHLTGCYNFYNFQYVVGILEEQVIEENNPQYQEIVEDLKKTPVKSVLPLDTGNSPFVDPDFLSKLVTQANSKMLRKNN